MGGAQGILGTATNVFSFLKGKNTDTTEYDYQMNMGHPQKDSPQKGIPIGVWVIGAITVVAVGGYLYTQSQKNKANATAITNAATNQ